LKETDRPAGERKYLILDTYIGKSYEGLTVMGGDYQAKNLVTIYQVFKSLEGKLIFTDEDIKNGISRVVINTGLSGRWQVLGHNPLTVCDTGHNKEGLEYVLNQIQRIPKTALHIIIGFVNDKDLSSVLPLFPKNAYYYFTKASVPRALDEYILYKKAGEYGLSGNCYPDVRTAMKAAAEVASGTDMIFIGGSTFIVAEAL
jgi:dihydrofolate synthase/folylpolyglutamate synthase